MKVVCVRSVWATHPHLITLRGEPKVGETYTVLGLSPVSGGYILEEKPIFNTQNQEEGGWNPSNFVSAYETKRGGML